MRGQSESPTAGWGTAESLGGWGGAGPCLPSPSPKRARVRLVHLHCELGAHTLHLLGTAAVTANPASRPGPAPARPLAAPASP